MTKSAAANIHFSTLPLTEAPREFVAKIVRVFDVHKKGISTMELEKGLTSDSVMSLLRDDLCELGFKIEAGKGSAQKIKRAVFFRRRWKAVTTI